MTISAGRRFAIEQLPGATDETTLRQLFGFANIGRLIAEFSAEELDAICLELFGGA